MQRVKLKAATQDGAFQAGEFAYIKRESDSTYQTLLISEDKKRLSWVGVNEYEEVSEVSKPWIGFVSWFVHSLAMFLLLLLVPMPTPVRIGFALIVGHFSRYLNALIYKK